jgi:hypothetical protein
MRGPERSPAIWEVLVRIANEFGGEEGKAVAALAYKLPEPWTSGEAKQAGHCADHRHPPGRL